MPKDNRHIKDIENIAREVNSKLTAMDFNYDNHVVVRTDEGYACDTPAAFCLKDGEWYMVFAEHHETKVYHDAF